MKKIVVLGGGIGGYVSVKKIKSLTQDLGFSDYEITLIEKNEYHYMPPLFFDVALGYTTPEKTRAKLSSLEGKGVKVVQDEVQSVDLKNRTVKGAKSSYSYDYLIVSLGTDNGWDAYPGLDKEGYHNYDLDGAIKMNQALKEVKFGSNIVILIPELPFRCGIYPYEAATVLSDFYKAYGKAVNITLIDPMPSPASPLGKSISGFLLKELEERKINYIPNAQFQEIRSDNKTVVLKGSEVKYDLLIKVPPPRLPKALANSEGFAWKQDPRWTQVTPKGNHPEYCEVYFAGEHSLPPLGIGLAGVFVESLAETAASNLVGDMVGGMSPKQGLQPVTCVGYAGNAGWAGTCETPFDERSGMYSMNCYFLGKYAPAKFLKQAFYHGWLDGLEVV